MFATAGNTTNDGLVGALLNDRFAGYLGMTEAESPRRHHTSASPMRKGGSRTIGKLAGWVLLALGTWMLVSPQAVMGLNQVKWMHNYAFRGEVLLGVLVMSASLYLLDSNGALDDIDKFGPESRARL